VIAIIELIRGWSSQDLNDAISRVSAARPKSIVRIPVRQFRALANVTCFSSRKCANYGDKLVFRDDYSPGLE